MIDEQRGVKWPRQPRSMAPSFSRKLWLTVGTVTALVLCLWAVGYAAASMLVIFAGVLVALLLHFLASLVADRTGIAPGWSLALVTMLLCVLALAGLWALATTVVMQIDTLADRLPAALEHLESELRQYEWGQSLLTQLPTWKEVVYDEARLHEARSAFSFLSSVLIALIIGFYLALDPETYWEGLMKLVPPAKRSRVRAVAAAVVSTLRWWIVGRTIAMLCIAVLTTLGLWILGVPLAITLGLLAGLLNFIPYLGPLLSFVPALLLALMQSPTLALSVCVLYVLIQFLESYVLTPLVQQQTVQLPPAVTIAALMLFGVFLGIPGLILGTPITAAGMVIGKELFVHDVLNGPPLEI